MIRLPWFTIIFTKEVTEMVAIYVALIIKGKKTINQVPAKIRDKAKEMLIDIDLPELAEEKE